MSGQKSFVPVRGIEENISAAKLGFHDGYLYFATDTGRIYLDYVDEHGAQIARAMVGNSAGGGAGNSGIYYANRTITDEEKLEDIITFPIDTIEGSDYPQKDDLIINVSEGSFYRVVNPSPLTSSVDALRLTISGGSGGSSTLEEDIFLRLETMESVNLINGQSAKLRFTATSAKDKRGNPLDDRVTITYSLAYTEDEKNFITYKTGSDIFTTDEIHELEVGLIARASSRTKITLTASQQNHRSTMTREVRITTSDLTLGLDPNFSTLDVFYPETLTLSCKAAGSMDRTIEFYFDDPDNPFYTETSLYNKDDPNSAETEFSINVKNVGGSQVSLTHGNHEVWIRLFQSINGRKGSEVTPLHFEVAVIQANNQKPIIWLGDYKTTYYNYDVIQIPYRVFDPNNPESAVVHFKKDGRELDNSPQEITDSSRFSYFEIADAELDVLNRYSISCGEDNRMTTREIEISVQKDPTRLDFGIQKQDYLTYALNTVGSGRSNNESEVKRQTLKYIYQVEENGEMVDREIKATLNNFNWYNNGWIRGTDGRTCLRISNGASVRIPIGSMRFGQGTFGADAIAHTIEIQFKVRNIQNYSNLIHNITRYNNDAALFAQFYDEDTQTYKTKYTNYDSFLAWYLREVNTDPTNPNPMTIVDEGATEPRLLEYDDLVYSHIQKQIELNNAFCSYYTQRSATEIIGLCLGPQDMFFSNGKDTVSASYVENEMVSLSIVYQHGNTAAQKLIMIYVNGILTSVIKNSEADGFTIGANELVFNSNSCDIDLYKIRTYRTNLSVSDIVKNYAADTEKVDIYDQNQLATMNPAINEYQFEYRKMLDYNIAHPNEPIMPYIIFDTTKVYPKDKQKLSYAKSVKLNIGVEFVNTPLEVAYSSGELEELAGPNGDGLWQDGATQEEKAAAVKLYYKHHCPSWISDFTTRADEIGPGVQMAVQGTSSEFYPRRNYKLKAKTKYDSDEQERIHIFLNRGPFQADFEADRLGVTQDKFILDNAGLKAGQTYYTDATGETPIALGGQDAPYEYNKYYIKNPAWVERGKEASRQNYWYMNNYTTGTTKWTMKIDFMESSGSYNMGFANLVGNAYSKHPLDDYNAAGAFQVEDTTQTIETPTTTYKAGKEYWYLSHKNEWKSTLSTSPDAGDLVVINDDPDIASAFANGPLAYAQAYNELHPDAKVTKVLGLVKDTGELNPSYPPSTPGYNTWYERVPGYKNFTIPNTSNYRTSVAGFRVLAFHKKLLQDGSIYYQYIGMYNMLLDKGSDEVYGFKPDKTCGNKTINQKFLKNKKISKIAECWEMENNNRTYCSFRDPDKRKDLTFDAFEMKNGQRVRKLSSTKSAPLVADSFEYRYNDEADALDYIMDPEKEADKLPGENFRFDKEHPEINQETRAEFLLDKYKNWEKACQWVWSTCMDHVPSQGEYNPIVVGKTLWEQNRFYLMATSEIYELDTGTAYDENINYYKYENDKYEMVDFDEELTWQPNTYYTKVDYIQDTGSAWDPELTYYDYDSTSKKYINVYAADAEHLFTNSNKINFYIKVNNEYISCINEAAFDESVEYYKLENYSDAQMDNLETQGKVDRLVRKTTADDVFDENEVYYTYDGNQPNGQATAKVSITQEDFDAKKGTDQAYYVGYTETKYLGKSYKYDTKEYRGDKFVNELKDHFDLEYMATYFVMTEVFECYDSRGKNCMMASWGPQKQGGDYIWYPIFYDIDTQLGVNNTGIPSFEYNVDATEDGNYSTSDSVLWMNFYKYFKSSYIIGKYKHLKGVTTGLFGSDLKLPPLDDVNTIEKWYNTDPEITGAIVMRGKRPIIAQNLDEYYKYITITNGRTEDDGSPLYQATQNGLVGHLSSNDKGEISIDDGKFFYMLQGNRSLSRRQFLSNRIEYIDSWLNQGDYQRAGNNRIQGRVAANNAIHTSDIWVEDINNPNESYFSPPDSTTKRHLFDGEYWLTLTPTHSTYVTYGDDNEAYPSQKYDGINPLRVNISAIESGVRTSRNYPEQLLYIYGMNHMSDLGDMSKLYWQEFNIIGDASKLTRLQFGYDGVVTDIDPADGQLKEMQYKNNNVNNPNFSAGKDSGGKGLPLLKYMNMSNISLRQGSAVLDLTSCEKLENFRATGSNYSEVKFADGVALNTLYLPRSLVALRLTEPRLLKNLITHYETPTRNLEGDLVAAPGLYLEGMFEDEGETNIATLNIFGGGLGYNSYKLLKRYFDIRRRQGSSSLVQMTNVQWSPYIQVSVDEDWDATAEYWQDNGHYGLVRYNYDPTTWSVKIKNKELYRKDPNVSIEDINQIDDSAIEMLNIFMANNNAFISTENNNVPNITGFIYINNATQVDEFEIRNGLGAKFPGLTFFFADVNEAYTAKFLLMDEDEGNNGTYTEVASQSIRSGWFEDPIALYRDIKDVLNTAKPNHDFLGWAATNSLSATLLASIDGTKQWPVSTLDSDIHTYYFYAICPIHSWDVSFYDSGTLISTVKVPHGSTCNGPSVTPYRDDSELDLDKTYSLLGYGRSENAKTPIVLKDFPITGDINFYTIWDTEFKSVFENVHPEYFRVISVNQQGASIVLNTKIYGKLTIPYEISYNGQTLPVVSFGSSVYDPSLRVQTSDPLLADVTHVFFAKQTNGNTSVANIEPYCFFNCKQLKYFEFTAPGLQSIGSNAFQNVENLILSSQISGTINTLGGVSFTSSFGNFDNQLILIDGNVNTINNTTFRNASATLSNVIYQFGTEEHPCTIYQITQYNPSAASSTSNAPFYRTFQASNGTMLAKKIIIYVQDSSFWNSYNDVSSQYDGSAYKALLASMCSATQANLILAELGGNLESLSNFLQVLYPGSGQT